MKRISKKQAEKQRNWNNLVKFLSQFTVGKTECCRCFVFQHDGAHIIPKTRAGCTWTAKNCLLVSRWCGCHDHGKYGDGLKMGIEAALEIARKRNEKYGINPDYDGSRDSKQFLEEMV
jgi:hypothetical protein